MMNMKKWREWRERRKGRKMKNNRKLEVTKKRKWSIQGPPVVVGNP